jgi:SAM-dependent methyltransferase
VSEPEWLVTNRRLWEGWAEAHAGGALYDLQGFVAGRSDLRDWEINEVGPVDGLDLIHLQSHIGTDSLDWARRGANVTALDFSARALRTVRGLANWAGLQVETIEADVYDAVSAVGNRRFDVVYTGVGALNWLPNLDRWATVVAGLLRPGGFLYLYEVHPIVSAMNDEGSMFAEDLIGGAFSRYEGRQGSYGAPDATFEHTAGYERVHGLGELFSAVLDAGLRIESFREFELTPAPVPFLERRPDGLFGFPAGARRFPLSYSMRAAAAN